MARPTKYNEEMQEKADHYLEHYPEEGDLVPTGEGLSLVLGVSRATLYVWEKAFPLFSDTLDRMNATQSKALINGGLGGEYNSTITKLMLANHGYIEKQEQKTELNLTYDGMTDEQLKKQLSLLTKANEG